MVVVLLPLAGPVEDLALLARYCERFDVTAVCDEVWEHVVFDGARHVPLMALPGMRGRTVKIGSAGKIFSLTGWKVGFVMAAPALLRVVANAHQFLTFTTPPALQEAVAYGLAKPPGWFDAIVHRALAKRPTDRFATTFEFKQALIGAIGRIRRPGFTVSRGDRDRAGQVMA